MEGPNKRLGAQETEGDTVEHTEYIEKPMKKHCLVSEKDATETKVLQSRIDEQSSLICILKTRADELFVRCQALQEINTDLENRMSDSQKELGAARKRVETINKRFMDLSANNRAIITFKDEYKHLNDILRRENEQLRSKNETHISKILQDKEEIVQKQEEEIKLLTKKYTNMEKEYREKIAGYQSKLLEQAQQHQAKETLLLDELHVAQQMHKTAEICEDLKLKLQKAEDELALKEISTKERIEDLNKEKNTLMHLSIEREKLIQEKQAEIQQLEKKWEQENKARAKAENRFEREAKAVNADVKVKSLQSALDEYTEKYEMLQKNFEAFKEHSAHLLTQEKELNKKLRYLVT